LPRKEDMMRFEKEAMNMNKKVEKLKRSLREYKVAAIMDIVVFVGVLIALAFVPNIPRYILVPILTSVLFINGIGILQLIGKTAEVLKGVVPVEGDE
jgi:ABC-type long-subunit fatty acid transport system fused permease/ATPase subunit